MASFIWIVVVLRAGYPGASDEYLIASSAVGIALMNIGFLVLVIAILLPN
jgi:preprotein translocase subunit Sss1